MGYKKANTLPYWGAFNSTNPSDNTTYYTGRNIDVSFGTIYAQHEHYMLFDGTITAASIQALASDYGTGEDWAWVIRVNDSTDYTFDTIAFAGGARNWVNTNLSIPISAGDTVAFKTTTPIWVGEPSGVKGQTVLILAI